jgi:hypothetical protein
MPIITEIRHVVKSERYWIFVDGQYCTSVRARTFPALALAVGQEITCDKVIDLEKFHWKHKYGEQAWEKEKVRIDRVTNIIETKFPGLKVSVVGFGADSNAFLAEHPDESGKPDLLIEGRESGRKYCMLEVSGTEIMRGDSYWVRPDKLSYAQKHPTEDVWVCLHYSQPSEKLVFIRPKPETEYRPSEKEIRGSIEHYVEFSEHSDEHKNADDFFDYLLSKRGLK